MTSAKRIYFRGHFLYGHASSSEFKSSKLVEAKLFGMIFSFVRAVFLRFGSNGPGVPDILDTEDEDCLDLRRHLNTRW